MKRKTLEEIFSKKKERKSLEEIFSRHDSSRPEFSEEQKAKIAANNAAYAEKYNPQEEAPSAALELLQKVAPPVAMGVKAGKKLAGSNFVKGLREMNVDDWLDVAGQSLQGIERVADGATLGAYGWANRRLGGNYEERKESLQRQAEQAGIGTLNTLTGAGLELGGNIAGAGGALFNGLAKTGLKGVKLAGTSGFAEGGISGLMKADKLEDIPENMIVQGADGLLYSLIPYGMMKPFSNKIDKVTNSISHLTGKQKLAKQLQKGKDFSDVKLGKMEAKRLDDINAVRAAENVDKIDSSDVIIPADQVEHLYQKRILGDRYDPKEVGKVLNSALFGKGSKAVKGRYPTLQAVVDDAEKNMNVAIVGKHRDNGNIFVKTGYKKRAGNSLEGRNSPSSDPNLYNSSGSMLSARQTATGTGNITPNMGNVNNNQYSRAFIEALADTEKSTKMKKAVRAGEEKLSEDASYISDQLLHRKEGMFDEAFEQAIKTPELAKAEKAYNDFFATNGNKTLAPEKVANFYENHPIAKGILNEMREVDPRAFDDIAPGSLAEFDLLKRLLRDEAGNKTGVKGTQRAAMKRAENSLKNLMDNEFKGFKDVNKEFARAKTIQNQFESKLKKGANSVGNEKKSDFWSGWSSPFLTGMGIVGGAINPTVAASVAAGLVGKGIGRAIQRNTGRKIAEGIIDAELNPELVKYLVATGNVTADDYGMLQYLSGLYNRMRDGPEKGGKDGFI